MSRRGTSSRSLTCCIAIMGVGLLGTISTDASAYRTGVYRGGAYRGGVYRGGVYRGGYPVAFAREWRSHRCCRRRCCCGRCCRLLRRLLQRSCPSVVHTATVVMPLQPLHTHAIIIADTRKKSYTRWVKSGADGLWNGPV